MLSLRKSNTGFVLSQKAATRMRREFLQRLIALRSIHSIVRLTNNHFANVRTVGHRNKHKMICEKKAQQIPISFPPINKANIQERTQPTPNFTINYFTNVIIQRAEAMPINFESDHAKHVAMIAVKITNEYSIALEDIKFLGEMISLHIVPHSKPLGKLDSTTNNIFFIGDIHGDIKAMLYHLMCGDLEKDKFMFLGDLIDRGAHSVEVLSLFFCLRLLFPESVFGIRGNHEDETVFNIYGFVQEVSSKYFPDISIYAWAIPEDKARIKEITNIFKNWMFTLPFASIVNNKIVCIHGSVSHGWSLEKANSLDPNFETTLTKINDTTTLNAMWSDPHEHDSDFPNQRGCGMIVSTKTIKDVCIANGLDLQIRAHQVANNGFEMLKYNGETISITIFGTPNYCGFAGNLAGFAILRSNGTLELRSFSSTEMHEAFAPQTFDT